MWNWKNQGSGEKFYNMSQNWGNPTTFAVLIKYIKRLSTVAVNHHTKFQANTSIHD